MLNESEMFERLQKELELTTGNEKGTKVVIRSKVYRKIYERQFGKIPAYWDVHHIDINRENNELSNLIAIPQMVHWRIHQEMERDRVIYNREKIEEILGEFLIYEREREILDRPWRAGINRIKSLAKRKKEKEKQAKSFSISKANKNRMINKIKKKNKFSNIQQLDNQSRVIRGNPKTKLKKKSNLYK